MFNNININEFFGLGFQQSSFVTFMAFILGYFISWSKKKIRFFTIILKRIYLFLLRKKYIIIWNDHHIEISKKIINCLYDKGISYKLIAIKEPDALLMYPLTPKCVHEIIFMVTDVTKLSELESKRILIQERILSYVEEGGILFGTHDLIYRRCRNNILQKAYGCEIYDFTRLTEPIKAQMIENMEHPILKDVDKNLEFEDGEVCYGDWGSDTIILIETVRKFKNWNNRKVPLLTIRSYGRNGILIWLNSADKTDVVAKSLAEPYGNIVKLIYNSIKYNKEIVNFHKSKIGHMK